MFDPKPDPKTIRTHLAACLAGALLLAGSAEVPAADWYARLNLGANFAGDDNLNGTGGFGGTADPDYDTGWLGGAAVGVAFDRLRFETEINYRRNGIEEVNLGGTAYDDGDLASLAIGFNALFEFDLLPRENVRSYVGAGIVYLEEVDIDLDDGTTERSFSDSGLAGQFIAGARYALWDNWDLYAEYRYLNGGSLDLDREDGAGRIETDYSSHTLSFGIGFRF